MKHFYRFQPDQAKTLDNNKIIVLLFHCAVAFVGCRLLILVWILLFVCLHVYPNFAQLKQLMKDRIDTITVSGIGTELEYP